MSEQTVSLSSLAPATGSKKRRKRVGLGSGSGSGKTCGRGGKGQTARSGSSIPAGFEGGQMPIHRRLPKRGFTSRRRVRGQNVFAIVQLSKLLEIDAKEVTIALLRENNLVAGSASKKVKIIGSAVLTKAVTVEVDAISAGARAEIERVGGSVRLRD
jgi:large subunit ribosomal protein L15